jgi:hypothetical protein
MVRRVPAVALPAAAVYAQGRVDRLPDDAFSHGGTRDLGRGMDAFGKYRDVSSFALSLTDDGLLLTWFVGVRRP